MNEAEGYGKRLIITMYARNVKEGHLITIFFEGEINRNKGIIVG
jgi:hypothetical protein